MSNACACMKQLPTLVLMRDLRFVSIYALLILLRRVFPSHPCIRSSNLLTATMFEGLFTVMEHDQIQNPRMSSIIVYYQQK